MYDASGAEKGLLLIGEYNRMYDASEGQTRVCLIGGDII